MVRMVALNGQSLVEMLPSVKAVRTTDAVMVNSLGLETPVNLTLQVVGGVVIVALCHQEGRILGRMANVPAHPMVAGEVTINLVLLIATVAMLNQVKVRGHETLITGTRDLATQMSRVKGHTTPGMDNRGHTSPPEEIKSHISLQEGIKVHTTLLQISHQGQTMNSVVRSQGHIVRQGTILQTQPLHHLHRVVGVVMYVENIAVIRTFTTVSDGILIKAVTFVVDTVATLSFTELKVKDLKDRSPSSLFPIRETSSGDRDRATGPHHRVKAARRTTPLRSSWDV